MNESGDIRLRPIRLPEDVELAIPWYRDREVLRLSEGEGTKPFSTSKIARMYEVLGGKGEVYIIEVRNPDLTWRPIGDVALCPDSVPIVIGEPSFRSRGIGTQVLAMVVSRARELGWRSLRVKGVFPDNQRAIRLFEQAGFVRDPVLYRDAAGNAMIRMEKALE